MIPCHKISQDQQGKYLINPMLNSFTGDKKTVKIKNKIKQNTSEKI